MRRLINGAGKLKVDSGLKMLIDQTHIVLARDKPVRQKTRSSEFRFVEKRIRKFLVDL